MVERQSPRFRGVTNIADPQGDFDFNYPSCPYRLTLTVSAGDVDRFDRPVEVDLSGKLPQGSDRPFHPVRVVELDKQGKPADRDVLFQWDAGAHAGTGAGGKLTFLLSGETRAGAQRRYQVYLGQHFRVPSEMAPLVMQGAAQLSVEDDVMHEEQQSFKISAPDVTYYYHKAGAGFASLEDRDGRDWIGYHPGGRSAGEFRGIPNLVEPEGCFHPGDPNSTSTLTSRGPLKVSIASRSNNGLWAGEWDIFPRFARLTVLKVGHPHWFLYEGTPGGELDTENGFMVRAPGVRTPLSERWNEPLPHPKWAYFGSSEYHRVLYLLHQEDDGTMDSYWPMNGEMTVFGFGRHGMNIYMQKTPARFSFGLLDTGEGVDDSAILRQILDVYYDPNVEIGNLEKNG